MSSASAFYFTGDHHGLEGGQTKKGKPLRAKQVMTFAETVRGARCQYWLMAFPFRGRSDCPPASLLTLASQTCLCSKRASSQEVAEEVKSVLWRWRAGSGAPNVSRDSQGAVTRRRGLTSSLLFWHGRTFTAQVGTKPHPLGGQGHHSRTHKSIILAKGGRALKKLINPSELSNHRN